MYRNNPCIMYISTTFHFQPLPNFWSMQLTVTHFYSVSIKGRSSDARTKTETSDDRAGSQHILTPAPNPNLLRLTRRGTDKNFKRAASWKHKLCMLSFTQAHMAHSFRERKIQTLAFTPKAKQQQQKTSLCTTAARGPVTRACCAKECHFSKDWLIF